LNKSATPDTTLQYELTAAGLVRDRIVTLRQPAPPARAEARP